MRRLVPFLFILSAGLLASCSLTLFDYSNLNTKRYALVYGVARYATSTAGQPPNLNFPGSDAAAVASMLQSEGYSVTSRWVDAAGEEWYDGGDTGLTFSTDVGGTYTPSKTNIQGDLANLAAVAGPNDLVVFYFSGHGTQDAGQSPPVEYIVPEGAVQGGAAQASLSISDQELAAYISPLATRRRVVILDTCNSGGFIGNTLEADSIPPASNGSSGGVSLQALSQALSNYLSFPSLVSPGISPYGEGMVLSAAGRDESCYEAASPYDHGVMTYFFLQSPKSGDLNHDGHVTVSEAFSLVKAGIDAQWNASYPASAFEPRISGGPVDFVLW